MQIDDEGTHKNDAFGNNTSYTALDTSVGSVNKEVVNMYDKCIAYLNQRGVQLEDIAECVLFLQKEYHPQLTKEKCLQAIREVLHKREVQHALLTGICLDLAAEEQVLDDDDLQYILMQDSALYGLDEVLAYGICNLYGSIALTNYGYIDKCKPGIISELNKDHKDTCNTFLDDIVGAIAAASAGKLAHNLDQPSTHKKETSLHQQDEPNSQRTPT